VTTRAFQQRSGGALDPDTDVYIDRSADAELRELTKALEYCNVLTSRQVGKTSLINRTARFLLSSGYRVAVIDVAGNLGSPSTANEWYLAFVGELSRQIHADLDAHLVWNSSDEENANLRLLRFFRELVSEVPEPIIVFVDEIDHTLKFDFTDDFFTAIRSMYNQRPLEPLYRRIAFCLVGVATPNELVKNTRTTAYNIGRTVELLDFDTSRDNLKPLYAVVSDDAAKGEQIVQQVLYWTGGHPYLTVRLCREYVAENINEAVDVDALVNHRYNQLSTLKTDVHFQQITRFLAERLSDGPSTFALYERALRGRRTPDEATITHSLLKLSGLVKRDREANLIVRNRIYKQVFGLPWLRQSRPLRARRKLQQIVAFTSVFSILLLIVGAYNRVVIQPAAASFAELHATSDEAVATSRFEQLTGVRGPVWRRWLPTGYGRAAHPALREFWERRALRFDERAQQQMSAGKIDEALIFAAAAAVKRHGAVYAPLLDEFNKRGLNELVATVRPSLAAFNESQISSFTDKSLLIEWRSRSGVDTILTKVDPESGRRQWQRQFDATAGYFTFADTEGTAFWRWQNGDDRVLTDIATGHERTRVVGNFSLTYSFYFAPEYWAETNERLGVSKATDHLIVWDSSTGRELLDVPGVSATAIGVSGDRQVIAVETRQAVQFYKAGTTLPFGEFSLPLSGDESAMIKVLPNLAIVWTHGARSPKGVGEIRIFTFAGRLLYRVSGDPTLPWPVPLGLLGSTSFEGSSAKTHMVVLPSLHELPPVDGTFAGSTTDASMAVTLSDLEYKFWSIRGSEIKVVGTLPRLKNAHGEIFVFSPSGANVASYSGDSSDERVRIWNLSGILQGGKISASLDPAELWRTWQTKLGLTLNDTEDIVPLWSNPDGTSPGPHPIPGWNPSIQ
jgi:hypothetical protein